MTFTLLRNSRLPILTRAWILTRKALIQMKDLSEELK